MDVEQYKMFLTVANCGSISEAARQLNIAQPALSIKMKKMAEECRAELFEKKKGGHGVQLTMAGSIVYNKAQQICDLENSMLYEVRDYNEGLRGILRLQVFAWENEEMVYKAIKGFHELYPEVKFEIAEKGSGESEGYSFECDLAILSQEQLMNYENTKEILICDPCPLFVVVAKDSKFIPEDKSSVTLKDLDNIPLIIPKQSVGSDFISCMLHERCRVNVISYGHYRRGDLYMARAGLGAALVFRDDDSKYFPDLRYIKLENSKLQYSSVIGKKQGTELSLLMRKFIDYHLEHCSHSRSQITPKNYGLLK